MRVWEIKSKSNGPKFICSENDWVKETNLCCFCVSEKRCAQSFLNEKKEVFEEIKY